MADDPDPGRIDALERRIASLKGKDKRAPSAMKGIGQGKPPGAW
jgi:hypothetical protein